MKVWAIVRTHQKIERDIVMEFPGGRPASLEEWYPVLDALCQTLHESRPVMLNKHFTHLTRFARAEFLPADFMESVNFDKFELSIFPEKDTKQSASNSQAY